MLLCGLAMGIIAVLIVAVVVVITMVIMGITEDDWNEVRLGSLIMIRVISPRLRDAHSALAMQEFWERKRNNKSYEEWLNEKLQDRPIRE